MSGLGNHSPYRNGQYDISRNKRPPVRENRAGQFLDLAPHTRQAQGNLVLNVIHVKKRVPDAEKREDQDTVYSCGNNPLPG